MNRISVCIFKRAGRKFYEAQWADPETGRKKTRSTGTDRKRDAERFAGNLERELRRGTFREPQRVTWDEFRERFETEVFPTYREKTRLKYASTFNAVEDIINPKSLAALNGSAVSTLAAKLRETGREEPTVKGHLSCLRRVLRWAHRKNLIAAVPDIEMPETTATTGRAVTTEEFERMLAKVRSVCAAKLLRQRTRLILRICRGEALRDDLDAVDARIQQTVRSWSYLLRGLWWSGLRLGEAMSLSWDDDRRIMADFTGRRPMFLIAARGQKNKRDSLTPMAPEFAEFLMQTPQDDRSGYVFDQATMRQDTVSKMIRRIGVAAGVKVGEYDRSMRPKHAGAHDLRRAFGSRWAMRVLPPVLKELMRHADIQTTMRYYVSRDAQTMADAVWDAVANTSANSGISDSAGLELADSASAVSV